MSKTPSHYSLRSQQSLSNFPNTFRFIEQLQLQPPDAPRKLQPTRVVLKSRLSNLSSFASRLRSGSLDSRSSQSSYSTNSSLSSSLSDSPSSSVDFDSDFVNTSSSLSNMGGRFWSRIKAYSGEDTTVDAAEWLEEYELVADEADYSDAQKTKYIQLVLDGTAKSWYKSALKRYEEKLKVESPAAAASAVESADEGKWNVLKQEFISHFTPNSVLNDAMLRQRVFAANQKSKESVATYASELLSLLNQIKSEPFTEKQQIDVFINGLQPAIKVALRRIMLSGTPYSTLSAAITAAQNEESLLKDIDASLNKKMSRATVSNVSIVDNSKHERKKSNSKCDSQVTAANVVEEILHELKPALKDLVKEVLVEERKAYYAKKQTPQFKSTADKSKITCYNCQQKGHFSSECTKPKVTKESSASTAKTQLVTTQDVHSSSISTPVASVTSTPTVVHNHLPSCRASLNGVDTVAVIDSGSVVNIVDAAVFSQLPLAARSALVKPSGRMKLVSAGGDDLHMIGTARLELQLEGQEDSRSVVFSVCEGLTSPMLLGMDFLSRHVKRFDISEMALVLHDSSSPVQCHFAAREEKTPVIEETQVYLVSRVVLQPRCETFVQAAVGCLKEQQRRAIVDQQTTVLFDSTGEAAKKANIHIARGVLEVDSCTDTIPVKIVNTSNAPITLHENSILGELEPVQQDQLIEANSVGVQIDELDVVGKFDDSAPVVGIEGVDLSHISNDEQRQSLMQLLKRFKHAFADPNLPPSRTQVVSHSINTGDSRPIAQQPYRKPHTEVKHEGEMIDKLLEQGVIRPSCSDWASPTVIVSKKDGTARFCVDYRRLNAVTVKDCYPLPRQDDTFDRLSPNKMHFISSLDCKDGYYHIPMSPNSIKKTAFTSQHGLFEFVVMPFGVTGGPSTYQRMMDVLMSGLRFECVMVYLDDLIVFSNSFEKHLNDLEQVFKRLASANIKLKGSKCQFLKDEISFLGHIVSKEGISVDPVKVQKLLDLPIPKTLRELRAFIGLASYYRRFIPGFATISAPLNRLTKKGVSIDSWNSVCTEAFNSLKHALISAPVLRSPDFTRQFTVYTDASEYGIGGILAQHDDDNNEYVVCYASRTMTKAERNYTVTEKEALAVVYALRHFRPYLYGVTFRLVTDHSALRWLLDQKHAEGRIARWQLLLRDYDFTIEHRRGTQHGNADAMSRLVIPVSDCEDEIALTSAVHAVNSQPVDEDAEQVVSAPPLIDLSRCQAEDKYLSAVLHFLSTQRVPEDEELARLCQLEDWDAVFMMEENGVVKRVVKPKGGERMQLIAVPEFGNLRQTLLTQFHDSPLSGHLGFDRTLDRIQRSYWWPNMKSSVLNFVASCRQCATKKIIRHKKGIPLMHQETPGEPMQSIAMDILGPLPVTKRNNRFVIVFTDRFSRFVEIEALQDQEAATVADAFVKCILLRHGAPRVLLSDRGSNFLSGLMKEIYKRLSIDKRQTTAYHPAGNGLVERFNSTLLNIISMYVNSLQKNWDELLSFAAFSYNTSQHSTTKLSPFFVLHGRHPNLPIDIIMNRADSIYNNQHDYTNELCRKLRLAHSTVNEEMKKVMARYEKLNDKLKSRLSFDVGDKVWKRTVPKPNVNRKLFHPFDGPFIVSEKRNDLLYKIHREGDDPSKGELINVDKLKPFVARQQPTDASRELFTIDQQQDAVVAADESQPLLFSHGDVVWLLRRHSKRSSATVHRDGPFEVLLKSSRNGNYHIKEMRQPKHRLNYKLRDYSNIPADRLHLCTPDECKERLSES